VSPPLVLVSHALCPYVQRAAIVLAEKASRSSAATST
jgi:glutathione S-transferase